MGPHDTQRIIKTSRCNLTRHWTSYYGSTSKMAQGLKEAEEEEKGSGGIEASALLLNQCSSANGGKDEGKT